MIKNKRAKQILKQVSSWDKYRPINKRMNNNVVLSIDSSGMLTLFNKSLSGDLLDRALREYAFYSDLNR